MLSKVCSFVAILLAAALLQSEAGAATNTCAKGGPFALRPDPDSLRDDVVVEPIELPTSLRKRVRTTEQKRRADRVVCPDPRTGKMITLPNPPHTMKRLMKNYPGGDDSGLPGYEIRRDAATPLVKTAAMTTAWVFGSDDRQLINPASSFPNSAVARLRTTWSIGPRTFCTGFFIGRRHVLTAGHCVFKASRGGNMVSMTVTPGLGTIPPFDAIHRPFGVANAAFFRASSGWIEDEDTPDYDWALVTLDRDVNVGSFGLLYPSDDTLDDTTAYLIGYPTALGTPKGGQQFAVPGGGSLFAYDGERVEYKIDATKGQSGSPVYRFWEGKRAAFAIHTTAVDPTVGSKYNAGPRITKHRYFLIRGWQCEDVCE
jgi:V8-like Glu-specific endopeptidase